MSNATLAWNDTDSVERPDVWAVGKSPYGGRPADPAPPRDRIANDEGVWGGIATVTGTRIPVFFIADLCTQGESPQAILRRYPHLTLSDVHAALAYAYDFEGIVAQERNRYQRAVERYQR